VESGKCIHVVLLGESSRPIPQKSCFTCNVTPPPNSPNPGAQPRFQSWGVQLLGLGYCTEQNTDGRLYPVSCTAVCYVTVIALFIKNVGVVRPNFLGVPSGCALVRTSPHCQNRCVVNAVRTRDSKSADDTRHPTSFTALDRHCRKEQDI